MSFKIVKCFVPSCRGLTQNYVILTKKEICGSQIIADVQTTDRQRPSSVTLDLGFKTKYFERTRKSLRSTSADPGVVRFSGFENCNLQVERIWRDEEKRSRGSDFQARVALIEPTTLRLL